MNTYEIGSEEIYSFQWDWIDSNMYLIICDDEALVVDPVDTDEAKQFMKKANVKSVLVLITHEHFDHISGVNWLRDNFDTKVCCQKFCAERISSAKTNLSDKSEVISMFNKKFENNRYIEPFECKADIIYADEYNFAWHNLNIRIISTPGHSPGSVCIFCNNKFAFTGDTLLKYPIITRFPGGSRKVYDDITIPILKKYADLNLVAFPGHGESFYMSENEL